MLFIEFVRSILVITVTNLLTNQFQLAKLNIHGH